MGFRVLGFWGLGFGVWGFFSRCVLSFQHLLLVLSFPADPSLRSLRGLRGFSFGLGVLNPKP